MMRWAGQSVLVTGAGGFIGSHLVEALVGAGARVRALVRYNARNDWGSLGALPHATRNEIEAVFGDVRDPFFVGRITQGVSIVFHLAALVAIPYSQVAPQSYVETNVLGTLNVLEGSLRGEVGRIIHTSSSEAYGTALRVPMDEAHPLQAQSPYAASKIAADKLAESYYRSYGLPVITVRPFNAFGPRQSARAVIPSIASQAVNRPSIQVGSLSPIRDFTYVTDIVAAYMLIAQASGVSGEVFNVGTGRGIAIGDLAARIQQLMGTNRAVERSEVRVRSATSEVETLICDAGKIRALTGWSPSVSLDDGLLRTIRWIESHIHLYRTELYNT